MRTDYYRLPSHGFLVQEMKRAGLNENDAIAAAVWIQRVITSRAKKGNSSADKDLLKDIEQASKRLQGKLAKLLADDPANHRDLCGTFTDLLVGNATLQEWYSYGPPDPDTELDRGLDKYCSSLSIQAVLSTLDDACNLVKEYRPRQVNTSLIEDLVHLFESHNLPLTMTYMSPLAAIFAEITQRPIDSAVEALKVWRKKTREN